MLRKDRSAEIGLAQKVEADDDVLPLPGLHPRLAADDGADVADVVLGGHDGRADADGKRRRGVAIATEPVERDTHGGSLRLGERGFSHLLISRFAVRLAGTRTVPFLHVDRRLRAIHQGTFDYSLIIAKNLRRWCLMMDDRWASCLA